MSVRERIARALHAKECELNSEAATLWPKFEGDDVVEYYCSLADAALIAINPALAPGDGIHGTDEICGELSEGV